MRLHASITNAITTILFVLCLGSLGFSQSYWKRTYPGMDAISAIPTGDGNFIVAGSTSSSGSYVSDIRLLKIKPSGDTIWSKTYGGAGEEQFSAITVIADGNFIVAGYTASFGAGSAIWLLKIKPDGDTIWTKKYEGSGFDGAVAITPTADNNFIVAGYTSTFDAGNDEIWLLKIKPNGDTIWTKTYGGKEYDRPQALTPTADGNFIVTGYTGSFGAGSDEIWLLKIKPNGDTIWTKTYGGVNSDLTTAITPTADGNFIVAGYTQSFGAGKDDIWLLKIKQNGDSIWTKTYGGKKYDRPQALTPTADGNFIVAGYTDSFGADGEDIWLLKIKPNGDTIWTKTYGGVGPDWPTAITPTADGNFLLIGLTEVDGTYQTQIISILADQYAYKDSPFTYKIPIYDVDSLNFAYIPLKTPAGMTVSPGGTISWTPTTSTVYMDHVEYLVLNDAGKKDTLTFNLFVNSSYHALTPVKSIHKTISNVKQFNIISNIPGKQVKFSLPALTSSLLIFDITGKIIDKITPEKSSVNNLFVWPTNYATSKNRIPTGKYFAKATTGKSSVVKSFLWVQ